MYSLKIKNVRELFYNPWIRKNKSTDFSSPSPLSPPSDWHQRQIREDSNL